MPTPGVVREFIGHVVADRPPCRRRRPSLPGPLPPRGGRKPKVAIIATHYQIDFAEHYLADYIAPAGSASSAGTPASAGSRAASCSTTHWSTSGWA